MAVYTSSHVSNVSPVIQIQEQTIQGMGRVGVHYTQSNQTVYEIADHLGNVRATVSSVKTNGNPEVLSYTDFYPHGGILPGRNYVSSNAYRYDYQGQEKDPETNWNNFELRMYDANLGRWMSPDPYGEFHSPYLAMGNNPVSTIDPDGGKTVAMAPEPPPEPEYDGRQDDWLIERRDAISEGGSYGNRNVSFDFTRVTDADGEVTWISGAISDIDFVSVGYELPNGQLGVAIVAVQAYYKGSNVPLLSDAVKIANIMIEGKILADEVVEKNASNVSESGLNFIASYEGFSATVYNDVAGLPTIGYGHLIKPGEKFSTITKKEALNLLQKDASFAVNSVKNNVRVKLSQNEFDALVSLTFNIGSGGFIESSVLRNVNAGNNSLIEKSFLKWNKARVNGVLVPVKGLTNRRQSEANLYLKGKY